MALAYAKLVKEAGLPLLVNFPSKDGYQIAEPAQLVSSRTAAIIVIVSEDLFPTSGHDPKIKIENEVIQALFSVARTNTGPRMFLVVVDEVSEVRIQNTWMSQLQWLRDSAITREQILERLRDLAESEPANEEMSAFDNAASIISAVELGSTIERIAAERVSAEKISYEIFECRHKIRQGDVHYYVHLHRWITISNTAAHLKLKYSHIFGSRDQTIVLSIEKGQRRLKDRIANIQTAFSCKDVQYLEGIASKLVSETMDVVSPARTHMVARKFVEPQVRKGLGTSNPPSEYRCVTDWLGSPRSGVLVLVGQGGIGKTWAMMNLRQIISTRRLHFTKPTDRNVVFISSTDIARGYGRLLHQAQEITLYDLYCASRDTDDTEDPRGRRLSRETFYNALELGSLIVFIDGLDEIITRHRGRFNAISFFNDLTERLTGESDGKVVVSCRNIFFDRDECQILFPYIETLELLAFDSDRRHKFFSDGLGEMPRRFKRAVDLSDRIAALPDGRFVPFVLDLIKDVLLEQADESGGDDVDRFQSEILNPSDVYDRVVGQFCHREMVKILDPLHELSVDEQVRIFCGVARHSGAPIGEVSRSVLELMVSALMRRKDVKGYVDNFVTHPFISQDVFASSRIVDFRFDFMPEYFLMLDALQRLVEGAGVDKDDIRVYNRFCSMNSPFCQGIVSRVTIPATDFRFRLIQMYEQAWDVIEKDFPAPEEELEILEPDSAVAHFSFALVSLLAAYETRLGPLASESFTSALREVFGVGDVLRRVALLDGFIREEERLKIDFRGLRVEECLFHSVDIWSCQFDEGTVFSRCRFLNCAGVFSRASGVHLATFEPDCQVDAEFERVYASGNKKIRSTETQNIEAIKTFVADFYRQGGFRRITKDNIERYYGHSGTGIPFNRIYRLMKRYAVIEEESRGNYVEVRIAREAAPAAERLITQGVLSGRLRDVAVDLR